MYEHLYIHVPFCYTKCDYCVFYSVPNATDEIIDKYIKQMDANLQSNSHLFGKLKSIYIGGGTPTLLSYKNLKLLFEMITKYLQFDENIEWSIECNPETLNEQKCDIICSYVNRVSIGVQSFDEKYRDILGRDVEQKFILSAFDMFQKREFENLNCDLIYAIPGQTVDEWIVELTTAVKLGVKHISAYSLTIEEGNKLASHIVPDETISNKMWIKTEEILSQYDFHRYEISNYSKTGFNCNHNSSIWHGEKYLGLGPASSSFDGSLRWTQVPDITKWLDGSPPEQDSISKERRARELFIIGLRTVIGWERESFKSKSQFDYMNWSAEISPFIDDGLIELTDNSIKLTTLGLNYWDSIAIELL